MAGQPSRDWARLCRRSLPFPGLLGWQEGEEPGLEPLRAEVRGHRAVREEEAVPPRGHKAEIPISLTVAIQCLETAFGVTVEDSDLALPQTLSDIFEAAASGKVSPASPVPIPGMMAAKVGDHQHRGHGRPCLGARKSPAEPPGLRDGRLKGAGLGKVQWLSCVWAGGTEGPEEPRADSTFRGGLSRGRAPQN